ncbi:hypothetical protein BDA99DRAFT_266968 [Phascolomyces articulosus]|uniref:Uncharacterized protein n=1 Tax=Phascolomyces articulosus TaxID=60185 RepID=A0AAD5JZ08_9FUNG|nr:hypothetical protein BDA99DRAFT_266968 [Phascolomyces articulosus]
MSTTKIDHFHPPIQDITTYGQKQLLITDGTKLVIGSKTFNALVTSSLRIDIKSTSQV